MCILNNLRGEVELEMWVFLFYFVFQFSFLMSSPFNTIKNRVLYFKKGMEIKKSQSYLSSCLSLAAFLRPLGSPRSAVVGSMARIMEFARTVEASTPAVSTDRIASITRY